MASELFVDKIYPGPNSGTTVSVPTGYEIRADKVLPNGGLPSGAIGGGILQVVQTVKQDYQTINNTEVDIITATINLKHPSSKVMVTWSIHMGRGDDDYGYLKLFEDSTEVTGAHGTSGSGNRPNALASISNRGAGQDQYFVNCLSGTYIHTPTTSSPTMKIRGKCTYGTSIHVNGPSNTSDSTWSIRTASFLHLYELYTP